MQITHFEQDNMRYAFEPPVEVGEVRVKSIHELAAIALIGTNASDDEIVASMRQFTHLLRSESHDRVGAFNAFLEGKHVVAGEQITPGMPAWSSATPIRGEVPGAALSSARSMQLMEQLADIDRAQMSVRGRDLVVYPSGFKS